MECIAVKNLGKIYKPNKKVSVDALNGFNLKVKKGEMIAVLGESGSGKSTLLHILGLLDKPTSGEYYFDDIFANDLSENKRATYRNKKFGFVLQQFGLINKRNCIENIVIPLLFCGISYKKSISTAKSVMKELNIEHLGKRDVDTLSGGQKQRVAIARALVNNPDIILADEPTGALDSKTSIDIMNVLKELNKKGKTIIIVTHDPIVADYCDRKIYIADGKNK